MERALEGGGSRRTDTFSKLEFRKEGTSKTKGDWPKLILIFGVPDVCIPIMGYISASRPTSL